MTEAGLEGRILRWAADFVEMAREDLGIALDYSEASVERVEEALGHLEKRVAAEPTEEERKNAMGSLALLAGAYLGEVVRRRFGGGWAERVPGREGYGMGVQVGSDWGFPMFSVLLRLSKGSQYGVERFVQDWVRALEEAVRLREAVPPDAPRDVAAEMAALSESAAGDAQRLFGLQLDFTEATLPALDEVLGRIRRALALSPEQQRRVVGAAGLKYGAYLGEVLRRHRGGAWVTGAPGAPAGLPVLCLGKDYAITMGAIVAVLEGQKVGTGEGAGAASAEAYYRTLARRQEEWLDRALRGPHPDRASLEADVSDDPELAEAVLAYVETALLTAEVKWGLPLDFSDESVHGVEKVLAQLHEAQTAAEGAASDEQVHQMAVVWGTYLGEVLRRRHGGRWVNTPVGEQGPVLRLRVGTTETFPLARVRKRILNGPGDDVRSYYEATGRLLRGELT